MITELRKTFFVETPLGTAEAFFIESDGGLERPVLVGVFQCETKEFWWWPNNQVRLCHSISAMRSLERSPIHLSSDMLETLTPHILRHAESPFYYRVKEPALDEI